MFSNHIIQFYKQLNSNWKLPKGIDLIYPFSDESVFNLFSIFCNSFYQSKGKRHFLFGINPGRFGAGMTGVPFTDPSALIKYCQIPNDIKGKKELSSIFIYDIIQEYGGTEKFYKDFYITSICPLGFTKDGKNYNYYDDKKLLKAVEPFIIDAINYQTSNYCKKEKAFSLGKGKNYKYFVEINEKHQWFDEIIPLPHPRWVMQYNLKQKHKYIEEYLDKLKS